MRHHTAPRRSPLQMLLDAAADPLAAEGEVRQPASSWLDAARLEVVRSQGCGWEMDTTPAARVERDLAAPGWAWAWEVNEIVLSLPGWTESDVGVRAYQPRLPLGL